jgi:UDP-N-acetyl-D-glucosamine/UDP-N-acetyl-D-galactosamine dehydrogenase
MEKFAILGLGYVGLPVALAFAKKHSGTIGFDVDTSKVEELRNGYDRNGEVSEDELRRTSLRVTSEIAELSAATFFVVAVPTPVDVHHVPDLGPVVRASETVGKVLKKGDVVVYESTVYPGVTEHICGPVLAKVSGLTQGVDFKLGYSPERINPGDREHTLERITKVVSAEDEGALERVAAAYESIVTAGVFRAASIKVAEAAKVIENTQRDLNIALMNELAIIFDRIGIRTADVLAAARTKWNFLDFRPGLVGGHCIGVDPFYLTTKAQELGYEPEVILAGRRINDNMGRYIASCLVKILVNADVPVKGARVGVLGLTFKENVRDIRNSKVPDIVAELRQFGIEAMVHDPLVDPDDAREEYGLQLVDRDALRAMDAIVLAVAHERFLAEGTAQLLASLRDGGVLIDVKSAVDPRSVGPRLRYWSL